MRGGVALLGASLLVGAMTGACTREGPPAAPPVHAEVVTLGVVSGLRGTLAPCGCTSRPLGGLDRLVARIEAEKEKGPFALLVVGDTFSAEATAGHLERQLRMKAELLGKALSRLEPWAVLPGLADQASGLLADLEKRFGLPIFARRNDEKPHLRPDSTVRQLGGLRIAVLGIPGATTGEAMSYTSAAAALRAQGAQFVIGLVPEGGTQGAQFVAGVDGIDVALTGGQREAVPARVIEKTLTVESHDEGRALGLLRLHRPGIASQGAQGAGAQASADWVFFDRGEQRRRSLEARIDRFRESIAALEPGAAREARAEKLAALEMELETLVVNPPDTPYVTWELVEIEQTLPSAEWTRALLADYDRALCPLMLEATSHRRCPPTDERERYVGNEACEECHEQAARLWKKSAHAGAWETLTERGKQCDPECIRCHTTGYEEPGGFCRLRDSDAHRDVGCESCHGPGAGHVAQPDAPAHWGARFTRANSEATCRVCHTPEHSDLFDFASYLPRILGPGHGSAEASED